MATISEALAIAAQQVQAGRAEAAEEICRRILSVEPNQPDAIHLLGRIALQAGKYAIAAHHIARAISLAPKVAEYHFSLGNAQRQNGQLPDAIVSYRHALQLMPGFPEALNNLGHILLGQKRFADAIDCYTRALQSRRNYAEAQNGLGSAFKGQGRIAEAIGCYQKAIGLKPDFAEAYNNLGNLFKEQQQPSNAVACYQRALQLGRNLAGTLNNLGAALKEVGELEQAIGCYKEALQLKPDLALAHSNLVYSLYFVPGSEAGEIWEEHHRWYQRHAAPLAKVTQTTHTNDPSPDRRLRIGYVSPDFRQHPVGRFLLPLLESHDHNGCEIFCYSSVAVPDAITERCRAQADRWRDSLELSDEQLTEAIRDDRIDILVDLTMHMAGSRLLVFARKPAPVQVTYLAYCGTTGLSTMDYRLTDPYLDPPGQDEACYSELSVRLPETYWCYRPFGPTPRVTPPCAARGTCDFRLPEQFQQGERAGDRDLGATLVGVARIAIAASCDSRQRARARRWHPDATRHLA